MLGGIFSEGIDLKDESLIGAVIGRNWDSDGVQGA